MREPLSHIPSDGVSHATIMSHELLQKAEPLGDNGVGGGGGEEPRLDELVWCTTVPWSVYRLEALGEGALKRAGENDGRVEPHATIAGKEGEPDEVGP